MMGSKALHIGPSVQVQYVPGAFMFFRMQGKNLLSAQLSLIYPAVFIDFGGGFRAAVKILLSRCQQRFQKVFLTDQAEEKRK